MVVQCKFCESRFVIKKGQARTKFSLKQVYQCKECGKKFVETTLQNKTYPPKIIYKSLCLYNLGYTLEETVKEINRRFRIRLPVSTLHHWLKEYRTMLAYSKWRSKFIREFKPEDILIGKPFIHHELQYNFKYHQAKLQYLSAVNQFKPLEAFIKKVTEGCPDYFGKDKRCSESASDISRPVHEENNLACEMAKWSLKSAKSRKERHQVVEDFMLINDSRTVAVEVPVWYWDKAMNAGVSGHIDILQIRKNKICILDYKPDADKEKKAGGQLYLYARALSFRTNIPLERFVCAWFDENHYYEFNFENYSMIFLIAFFLSSFMNINFINFQLSTFNF